MQQTEQGISWASIAILVVTVLLIAVYMIRWGIPAMERSAAVKAEIENWTPHEYEDRCAIVLRLLYDSLKTRLDHYVPRSVLINELRGGSRHMPAYTWADEEVSAAISRLKVYDYIVQGTGAGTENISLTAEGLRKVEFLMGYKNPDPDPRIKISKSKVIWHSPGSHIGKGTSVFGMDSQGLIALIEHFEQAVKSGQLEVSDKEGVHEAAAEAKAAIKAGSDPGRLRSAFRHLTKIVGGAAGSAAKDELTELFKEVINNIPPGAT